MFPWISFLRHMMFLFGCQELEYMGFYHVDCIVICFFYSFYTVLLNYICCIPHNFSVEVQAIILYLLCCMHCARASLHVFHLTSWIMAWRIVLESGINVFSRLKYTWTNCFCPARNLIIKLLLSILIIISTDRAKNIVQ